MIDFNQKTYNTQSIANWYSNYNQITDSEIEIFNSFKTEIEQSVLLDIGVGAGRTTTYLSKFAKQYIGIDYAEKLVETAKQKFPSLDIRCLDARDLSVFSDNTFDFVNFSFNGIDYVDVLGREKILCEINRVLKPNGIFFFSTHNKLHPSFNKRLWLYSNNSLFIKLKIFTKLIPFEIKHQLNKRKEAYTDEYAIINDSAHFYGLMTFYTTPDFLIQQLLKSGFSDINLHSKQGKVSPIHNLDEYIYATCKKIIF